MDAVLTALAEDRRTRRAMRDLVALSTLPAIWVGLDLEGIARSLARALIGTLSLDLIYIRLAGQSARTAIEVAGGKDKLDATQEAAVKRTLLPLCEWNHGEHDALVKNPFGDGTMRVAVVRFGMGDDRGVLVAASRADGLPSEQDRLLLSVGANQTAVVVQRRLAEDQEHEQREWLRVTLSSIGEAVIATDIDGRVTFMNPVAEKLTEWPQADARGKPLETVFAATDEESARALKAPAQCDTPRALRSVLLSRGGAEHAIDGSASPIRNSSGAIIGVVVVFRSTAEHRRAEQLRNTRLAVVQALNQATNTQEAARGVLKAVCENLGWDAGFLWTVHDEVDALACRAWWQHPAVPIPHFEAASRDRTFVRGEGLPGRVWASGQSEWLAITAQNPGFLRAGSAVEQGLHSGFACPVVIAERTIGALEFFSMRAQEAQPDLLEMMATVASNLGQFIERKAAEEELRRSEEELAEFFENASVGLHWVGSDGTILRANRAELDMLGYTREEYVGRPIADFHADEEVICDILDKLKSGEKLAEYPARLRCKDGSIKHVLIDSSVMWKDGSFVHTRCFTRDVTARLQAELALAAARSQL
jgi:PAS domain S-box-containing protein